MVESSSTSMNRLSAVSSREDNFIEIFSKFSTVIVPLLPLLNSGSKKKLKDN